MRNEKEGGEKRERLKVAFTSQRQGLHQGEPGDGRVALRPLTICEDTPLSLNDGVVLFCFFVFFF